MPGQRNDCFTKHYWLWRSDNRSNPSSTTRSGTVLTGGANCTWEALACATQRHMVPWTEWSLRKTSSSSAYPCAPRPTFNLVETDMPKIVLDIWCASATDDAKIALGCAKLRAWRRGWSTEFIFTWTQRAHDGRYPRFFRKQPVFMDQARTFAVLDGGKREPGLHEWHR